MKTTLAILGIFAAAALVAGTVVVTESYAITIKFQNAYKSQQNNQNSAQGASHRSREQWRIQASGFSQQQPEAT